MDCNGTRENLSALIDGELASLDRQEAERHLAGCAGCRAERDALAAVSGAVRALPVKEAPPGLAAGVRDRLARERLIGLPGDAPARRKTLPFPSWLRGAGLAAAAVLLVVLVGDFGGGARRDLPDDEAFPASFPEKKPGNTDSDAKAGADETKKTHATLQEKERAKGLSLAKTLSRDQSVPEQEAGEGESAGEIGGAGAVPAGDASDDRKRSAYGEGMGKLDLSKAAGQEEAKKMAGSTGEAPSEESTWKAPPPASAGRAARSAPGKGKGAATDGLPALVEIRLVPAADGRRAEAIGIIRNAMALSNRRIALKAEEAYGNERDKDGVANHEARKEEDGERVFEGEFTEEEITALLADLAGLGVVPRAGEDAARLEFRALQKDQAPGRVETETASPAPRRTYRLVLETAPADDKR